MVRRRRSNLTAKPPGLEADARQFFTDTDGISRPTKKGLAVSLRHLPELIALLGKALTKAHALGLIREGGA